MLSGAERERFLRHILLKEVGAQGQQKLRAARVLVVGAGGLGAPIIQYLAAAGVGALGLIDDDVVELSNLQRQVIYKTADVGAAKVDAAGAAAQALAPDLTVERRRERLTAANADALVGAYDLVVEGVDNFDARYVLNRACIAARRPLVSAAIGRFDGQLSVFKGYEPGQPCYRCFLPEPPPREDVVNCAEEGVLGPVAGVVGALAALEAIKEIVGVGESLAGRMVLFDGLSMTSRTVRLSQNTDCPDCRIV